MAAPLAAFAAKFALRAVARRTPGGAPTLILVALVVAVGGFLALINVATLSLAGGAAQSGGQGGCGPQTQAVAVLGDIPALPLAAYQQVGAATGLDWVYLAAVGRVESSHGGPNLGPDGTVRPPVFGVRLDGSTANTTIVRDTDKGALDRDPVFDRAVGPMQFLPSTWKMHGGDGNNDGVVDPQNYFDAVHAAARYLIASGAPRDMRGALWAYNRSTAYYNEVMTQAAAYRSAAQSPTGGQAALLAVPAALPPAQPTPEAGPAAAPAVDSCGLPYGATPVGGDRAWGGHPNGRIPAADLCPVLFQPGPVMRCDAAISVEQMNMMWRATFGSNICVGSAYRSYGEQAAVKEAKPHLAAAPGKSNHGWGLAVDFCGGIQNWNTPQHNWMVANAGRFGWFHPAWAQRGGSKPEPWHWEFGAAPTA
jgi:hypothetical protein